MAQRSRRNPSVMAHRFARVPSVAIPRSRFDRSHGYKTTFDAGYLVPILVDEVLPGDTFQVNVHGIIRLNTPIVPFMDNLMVDTQFFAIPKRLLWSNWQKFNGEQDNPEDTTDYLVPQINKTQGDVNYSEESIYDYYGLPIVDGPYSHSALPLRAYNLVYNEWYRDQNLQQSQPVSVGDGPDDPSLYKLLRRGKRHDYFTSCLPWPQKGDAVELPLGDTAPVVEGGADTQPRLRSASDPSLGFAVAASQNWAVAGGVATAENDAIGWQNSGLVTDLSSATAATINSLRQAFQLQRMLERDARGGSRYTEIVRSHFGVVSPDARLQRPEYLGGSSTPIFINPVANTAGATAASTGNVGDLSAVGTAMVDGHGFFQGFTEHCVILGLMSVRADLTYQQGLERFWSRQTRYDFYWPALSHIGEQAVLNKEIYTAGDANDDLVFGYQERFAEYRYKPSRITGKMRSSAAQSLDVWHLAQEFGNLPVLGATFIEDNPPVDRVVAVQTEPHFKGDFFITMKCTRPMPLHGVPGMIDHF